MVTKHAILYVPGLGDRNLKGRQWLINAWRFRNVGIEICTMDWSVGEPFELKLNRLLTRIDDLIQTDNQVSLVGESAGASTVIEALIRRDTLHKVVLLCGKSQYPDRVSPHLYRQNPAFKDSLAASAKSISLLTPEQKEKLINLHPLFDHVVPVPETKISGVKDHYMPSIGHATSIVFANTFWSWWIVHAIKK